MVALRLERRTSCMSGRRPNQLSYATGPAPRRATRPLTARRREGKRRPRKWPILTAKSCPRRSALCRSLDTVTHRVVANASQPPNPKKEYRMAEARARISFADVRASVKRMQTEGEKLVTRLRKDAQTLATRTRRETVSSLLSDARKLRTDIRDRAERAIRDIDSQRERIVATIEEQGSRLVERVVKGLNLVSAQDLASLNKRLGDIERRLQELLKERAA